MTSREAAPTLDELRAAIDAKLRETLDWARSAPAEGADLVAEIETLVLAGGKRVRPVFAYWGHRLAGGPHSDAIVTSAAALELLHTFAIVHDDIMDRSSTRRGAATVFARRGTDVAVLVGDLALVLADHVFLSSDFDPPTRLRAFDAYSRMRRDVIAGQYLDVVNTRNLEIGEAEARRIAVLKSGRYSIEEPLVIGAVLAGTDAERVAAAAAFGRPLGEAFQLRDDLWGTFGEPAALGKPVDDDIRSGKRNVLYAAAASRLSGRDRARFVALWGGGTALTDDEVAEVKALAESSGARARLEDLVDELAEAARAAAASFEGSISPGTIEALIHLAAGRKENDPIVPLTRG